MCPSHAQLDTHVDDHDQDSDLTLPVTSFECQWKLPKNRKESSLTMAEASFEKHIYGRKRKKSMDVLEEFDPRPVKHCNKVSERLPQYLESVDQCGLGISLLLDPKNTILE